MTPRATIRLEGEDAEIQFLALVSGARKTDSAKKGDAIVRVDGNDYYVEIKECHAAADKNGTINQARAIKYICCIVWAPNHNCWYVISPDQLVEVAASKIRGQHTEVPFESMNFGLHSLPEHLHTKCSDAELGETVAEAIRRGRKRASVGDLMELLLRDIINLRERYRDKVEDLLQGPSN